MVRHTLYQYDSSPTGYVSVLAGMCAEAARYAMIDASYFTGKTGEDGRLIKIARPGIFAGSISGSTKVRPLPRSYANGAIAASATSLIVDDASPFVANDVISILPPNARVSVTSTSGGWVADDTATVTIAGKSIVCTVVSGDVGGSLTATNTNVANKIRAAIAADPYLYPKVDTAIVAGNTPLMEILIWSKNFADTYTLAVADTATNGTLAIVGGGSALSTGGTAVGTVSAVNAATNTLTISSASVSVPDNVPVGVATSTPYDASGIPLGMLSPTQPLDLLYRESQNYALFHEAFVYRDILPYWDGQIARLFPEIQLV